MRRHNASVCSVADVREMIKLTKVLTRARISGGGDGGMSPPLGFYVLPTVCVPCIPTGDRKCYQRHVCVFTYLLPQYSVKQAL